VSAKLSRLQARLVPLSPRVVTPSSEAGDDLSLKRASPAARGTTYRLAVAGDQPAAPTTGSARSPIPQQETPYPIDSMRREVPVTGNSSGHANPTQEQHSDSQHRPRSRVLFLKNIFMIIFCFAPSIGLIVQIISPSFATTIARSTTSKLPRHGLIDEVADTRQTDRYDRADDGAKLVVPAVSRKRSSDFNAQNGNPHSCFQREICSVEPENPRES